MAALAADAPDAAYKGDIAEATREGDAIASDIIYANSLVFIAAAGGITPVPATGLKFAGIATKQVDNSAGALADKQVQYLDRGEVLFTGITATMARTNEDNLIYAASDNPADLTLTAGTNPPIGIITRYVSASKVWVRLNDFRTAAA